LYLYLRRGRDSNPR